MQGKCINRVHVHFPGEWRPANVYTCKQPQEQNRLDWLKILGEVLPFPVDVCMFFGISNFTGHIIHTICIMQTGHMGIVQGVPGHVFETQAATVMLNGSEWQLKYFRFNGFILYTLQWGEFVSTLRTCWYYCSSC